jgi:hypothetical protein
MNEDMIGVREAARILELTVPAIHYHITHGNLKIVGKFGSSFILSRTAVEAFKERRARR